MRAVTCETRTAGVASWISEVATSPVAMPAAFAISMSVLWGLPLMSMPIAPLYVFTPVDQAVPEAAESVT